MTILPLGTLTSVLLGWLMGFLSLFLIMLILIQRGKGGGLTGALGGPGGQSAFGSKAGDTFTAITIVVASLWGLTCIITMLVLGTEAYSPAIAEEPNMQAGPGDEEEPVSGLGGSPGFDFSGDAIGGTATSAETPAVELTPADAASDNATSDDAAGGDAADQGEAAAPQEAAAETESAEPESTEATPEN